MTKKQTWIGHEGGVRGNLQLEEAGGYDYPVIAAGYFDGSGYQVVGSGAPLPVSQQAILDADNSTTDQLNAAATYTGTWVLNNHADVMVSVSSDQNLTMLYQFSMDGSTVHTSLSFKYNTARINPPHVFTKGYRYFRIVLTNDGTSATTTLQAQTYYGTFNKLTAPINGTVAENYDATITRPTDYHHEVAMGKRQGRKTVHAFAHNDDVDTGTEIMASFGGTFTIMTSADTLNVVSSDANDDTGGSGCQTILIEGIDENYLAQFELVFMDGLTPVTTSNQWLGVNRAYTISGPNVGNITISDTSGTVGTQAYIAAGDGTSQACIYHTQINHNLLIDSWDTSARKDSGGGNPKVTFRLLSFSRVTLATYEIGRVEMDTQSETSTSKDWRNPLVTGGREVIYVTATTDTNNTPCTSRLTGIEERIS